jgi:hypothetical protein
MTGNGGLFGPGAVETHKAVADELLTALNSEPVQRFLTALKDIDDLERQAILDQVLTGPASMRVDLGLPRELQIARRFVGGPTSEFAISKRAPETGALVTIFVTLSPSADGPTVRQVLPWNHGAN